MDEFCISWTKKSEYAEVSAPNGSALKSKMLKYSKEYPDEVNNVVINKDGSLYCHMPIPYAHVSRPRKLSEKQRNAAKERFQKMWAERKRKETEETEVDMETGMEMLDEILDMELLDETDEDCEENKNA